MSKIEPLETVEFQIGKFATDFLRDYLTFLKSKDTVEDVARDALYDGILRLRDRVKALPHFSSEFLGKYEHLSILDSPEDRKRAEDEKEDC